MASIEEQSLALKNLENYQGRNPYLLGLRYDIIVLQRNDKFNDFNIEYINKNSSFNPIYINKAIKICEWLGKAKQSEWNTEFVPQKVKITWLLGETSKMYHGYIQYRQSVEPQLMFLPKSGIITNFLVDDYHNLSIDFERYDRLSLTRRPDKHRTLKNHQKDGVKFLLSRKKCILADDMGLGKTCELVVSAIEGNFDAVLIICPASLKTNWLEELTYYVPERDISIIGGFQKFNKTDFERYLGYGIGKSGKKLEELRTEAQEKGKWNENRFVIINYDILKDVFELPKSKKKEDILKAEKNRPILDFVKDKKTLIIIDEAHFLSNDDSGRYEIIKKLIDEGKPHSVYLATGTPITNNPQNLFNLLTLINAPIVDDKDKFLSMYCTVYNAPVNKAQKQKKDRIVATFLKNAGVSEYTQLSFEGRKKLAEILERSIISKKIIQGGKNLEELSERVSYLYLRRMKEDMNDLPPKHIHEIFYDLNAEQLMEYNKLWEEYESLKIDEKIKDRVERGLPITEEYIDNIDLNQDLVEGGIYRKYLSNQMVPNTVRLTDYYINYRNEKVVIACCYDEELYSIKNYYGDRCVVYNGKMNTTDKDEAKDAFMNDPTKMVFVGNIRAAGVGITLIASHVLIFNNISWVPGDNKQMEDRIYRLGQENEVEIYYQFFKETQYEKMWNTVVRKGMEISQVIKKESDK